MIERGQTQDGGLLILWPNRSGMLWSEDRDRWERLRTRAGCPWCQGPGPPEAEVIAQTDTCWVTAPVEATLPGYVCVSTKAHVVEPYELDADGVAAFFGDAMAAARGVARLMRPAKMNYEIHGNTIPHLHMHLFPRAANDPYVGFVITSRVFFRRTPEQIGALARAVRAELAASTTGSALG
jgi:diadenosine tetraphosphate (Ap4A) HIT family hydrolase